MSQAKQVTGERPSLGDRFQGDTREERVLRYVFEHATPGDPQSVLKEMDRCGYESGDFLMFVGDDKAPIITAAMQKTVPSVCFELGGYCGYSAVLLGAQARALNPAAKYYSFEFSEWFISIASEIVRFAGLSDTVEFVHGSFEESLGPFITAHPEIKRVDFVLIDHTKTRYLPDFKLLEATALLGQGSVVIGDNIVYPGAPDFKDYMLAHSDYTSELVDSNVEYHKDIKDSVLIALHK